MFKYSTSQLPRSIEEKQLIVNNLKGTTTQEIINNDIKQFNYRPVVMSESSERSHYFKKPEHNPLVPSHPLDRFSNKTTAYFDPNFESLEYDRLAFRGNLPRAIDSGLKNKSGYNVLVDAYGDELDYNNSERKTGSQFNWNKYHQYTLNTEAGQSFDKSFQGLHEENRYSLNDRNNQSYSHRIYDTNITTVPIDTPERLDKSALQSRGEFTPFPYSSDNIVRPSVISTNDYNTVNLQGIPLYPEVYPYIQRQNVNGRQPAGKSFSSVETQQLINNNEAFKLVPCSPDDNADFCASLTTKEMKDINNFLKRPTHKEGFNFTGKSCDDSSDSNNKFGNNGIIDDADYMYMSALKVRANAVCQYLKSNKAYSSWSHNWNLLERNLKGGKLFERLSETDADIAYVVNKGDEVKFRIRDKSRYVPINTYQYVLYHEMAHMSTEELQHTEFFMKLLNIISLAGFECGFIDFRKLPDSYYMTNGAPILCRNSMKEEVIGGAYWLKEVNPKSARYYDGIIAAVKGA